MCVVYIYSTNLCLISYIFNIRINGTYLLKVLCVKIHVNDKLKTTKAYITMLSTKI